MWHVANGPNAVFSSQPVSKTTSSATYMKSDKLTVSALSIHSINCRYSIVTTFESYAQPSVGSLHSNTYSTDRSAGPRPQVQESQVRFGSRLKNSSGSKISQNVADLCPRYRPLQLLLTLGLYGRRRGNCGVFWLQTARCWWFWHCRVLLFILSPDGALRVWLVLVAYSA